MWHTFFLGINHRLPSPVCASNLDNVVNISSLHRSSEDSWRYFMDESLLSELAPTSTLTVEHTNHTTTLVYVPNFKQAADHKIKFLLNTQLSYTSWQIKCYSISIRPFSISSWINEEAITCGSSWQLGAEN